MNDELIASLDDDGIFLSFEEIFIRDLRTQITDSYNEFTGLISNEDDCFENYIRRISTGADPSDIIETFERFCIDNKREDDFDLISNEIVKAFDELMGIKIDLDRGLTFFNDLYDIYLIFVLNIKESILLSTSGKMMLLEGLDNASDKITQEMVNDYILSDEFSVNDDFIKFAAFKSEMTSLSRIKDLITDNIVCFDQTKFVKYITDFIMKNPIK